MLESLKKKKLKKLAKNKFQMHIENRKEAIMFNNDNFQDQEPFKNISEPKSM